jgi:hypothetical protein
LLDTIAADRRHNPKLGKMCPDRIDHRGLLADQEMARAMEHQAALLLGRLGRNKPHIGPGNCLANGLSIRSIVLLPFDVGLHVSGWHQPHVAKCLELARPMMRRGAGFDANEARR